MDVILQRKASLGVCSYFSAIKTKPNQRGEERVDLTYPSLSQSAIVGSQGRNSGRSIEAGAEAEATKQHCVLTGLVSLARLSYLSYICQDHLPRDGPTYCDLGPLP